MAQEDLEFGKALQDFRKASNQLNVAGDRIVNSEVIFTKVLKAFGLGIAAQEAKTAIAFVQQARIRRQALKEVRERLGGKDPISKAQLKQLKREAKLTNKKEAVDKAFKSYVESNLGLNEQLLKELQQRQDREVLPGGMQVDDKGRYQTTPEKFLEKVVEESALARATAEKNRMGFSLGDAKSPGNKNRAAEEERRSDQQAFEMEKTESTNDILRDILAALTGGGIEKKEGGSGGFLAGLLGAKGLGALKKMIGGLATALGTAAVSGGKGAAKAGRGLLGKLGGLARIVGPGLPLLLGLGFAAGAFLLLKDRSEEFTKKVEEDSRRLTEAIKNAETPEEIKNVVDQSVKQNQTAGQEADRIRSAEKEKKQRQADSKRGRATQEMFNKGKVIEGSQDINQLIRNASVLFAARRDSAIEQGTTLKERTEYFDRSIAETIAKIKSSEVFLGADKKNQEFMIQQVVQAANKAIAGNRGKSALLYGLGPEALKDQAAIETSRGRMFMALQGATGKYAEEGFGRLSYLLGGGRNTFSASRVALLEARVAEAQKDADEVTWWERTVGSNQGDVDRLNSLTKELARLRDTIAKVGGNNTTVVAPNNSVVTNSSASVSHPIYIDDQSTKFYEQF